MATVDLLILERIRWDWFVSCTVQRRSVADRVLRTRFFALIRQIAGRQGMASDRIVWALRIESGVSLDHRHFHALVGGLRSVGQTERFWTMHKWSYLCGTRNPKNPRGTCRCRLYNPTRGAAAYLASELNTSEYKGWSEGFVELSHAAVAQAACAGSHRDGLLPRTGDNLPILGQASRDVVPRSGPTHNQATNLVYVSA
jgi:hypothetical protein